jgi:hypothetical protein
VFRTVTARRRKTALEKIKLKLIYLDFLNAFKLKKNALYKLTESAV